MVTITTGDNDNAYLAASLMRAKEDSGYSFAEVAARAGMSERQVNRFLRDERLMRIRDARALADALSVDFGQLMIEIVENIPR